jgi:CheY-like chemotaxis protein
MSHEIRTPLNAIIGFSQLLNREQLTDAQKEYVVSIHRSGEHLLRLINDILELSKIEAGRVELNPTNVDLHALFADIEMMFTGQAKAKQLHLIFETLADLPLNILVDDNKLRQILINLIGNALKFTAKGDISVRARIVQTNDLKSILVVEIQDSGAGISEHELGKIFRQFEQASAGIKQSSGTGLGLSLSRELAILMGGNITVASEDGKGSVFIFHVEVQIGKNEPEGKKIAKHVIGIDNHMNTIRILVVDDKEDNLKVVTNFLKLVGFETLEAVNGEDAISKFVSWNPHLILMDLRMPVMDGYEAIRRIKATSKGKQTPIIVLSASQFEEGKASLILPDIQGYIRKPFRENELFETIGKVLGIDYRYVEELPAVAVSLYLTSPEVVAEDVTKLPQELISQMREAVDIGDFYRLTDLLKAIEPGNPELAKHLKNYANNFDHDYLQQVIKTKGD